MTTKKVSKIEEQVKPKIWIPEEIEKEFRRDLMFPNEAFEKYWNLRVKYRHPEENTKEKKIFARKMFYSGWNYGTINIRRKLSEEVSEK